ncbi:MAG: arylesterase [Saprospiraceae bacterium]|nr:arylesterase [Saprospiraceae bacterium]
MKFHLNSVHTNFIIALLFLFISCKNESAPNQEVKKAAESNEESTTNARAENNKIIMFYGNSLTAGYRLEEHESFPSRIEDRIDSLNLAYSVINAGLSGDTSYDGLKRLDWVLNTKVDIFILELGANDMLRGLPLKNTRENLVQIVQKVKAKYPDAIIGICAMAGAPNMGADYVTEFEKIYTDIAKQEDITYIPFFLEGVAGNSDLLLQDGKHPNAEGQKIVAENIWKSLQNLLNAKKVIKI